jgi:hypothetical protein
MGTLVGERGVGLGESQFRRGDIHCGTLYILVGLASRARPCAARTRLFGRIATPNGVLRDPPAHRSFADSYLTPELSLRPELRPPQVRISFHWA